MSLPSPAPLVTNIEEARQAIEILWRHLVESANAVLSGNGTPEAAVTAPVGTIYRRLDGGAGTSIYIKESGAGNTGWVGK